VNERGIEPQNFPQLPHCA